MKLKATFAVLSSALLLQGCIAGVVVGSAAVARRRRLAGGARSQF